MAFSKLLKYSAVGVGLIIFGELYYELSKIARARLHLYDELEEINDVFCTRSPKNDKSVIVRQINFRREPTLFITEVLENLILSSRKTIHVAMYIFTSTILSDALKSANKKGVRIYVIVDHSMEAATGTQIPTLKEKGIAVKICYSNTLHHKFCLIDVPYNNNVFVTDGNSQNNNNGNMKANNTPSQVSLPMNGLLINGSLNWTREALTSNYENFIVTSNKNIIRQYYNEFVERWKISENSQ